MVATTDSFERDDGATEAIHRLGTDGGTASGTNAGNYGSNTGGAAGATGDYATVLGGDLCEATEDYATSCGYQAKASGPKSFALGDSTNARGENSVALGSSTYADGKNSFASGTSNYARSQGSATFGGVNEAGAEGSPHPENDESYAPGIAEGHFATALGTGNKAKAYASVALNQATEAWGRKSIAMGEDCRTGDLDLQIPYLEIAEYQGLSARYENGDVVEELSTRNDAGEAAFAGNHFSRVVGRASTTFGCNNLVPWAAMRSMAIGFGARPTNPQQFTMAAGGFQDPNEEHAEGPNRANSEGLHNAHTRGTGHAQTSTMVLRGETDGTATDQSASISGGSGWLACNNVRESVILIDDQKAVRVEVRVIAVDSTKTKFAHWNQVAIIKRDGASAAVVYGIIDAAPDNHTSDADEWKLNIGVYGAGFYVDVNTGNNEDAIRVCAEVNFQEVLFPDAFPSNEDWEVDDWNL